MKDMTFEKALKELSQMLLDYLPDNRDNDRFEELYGKVVNEMEDIDITLHHFTATVTFYFGEEEEFETTTNLISGDFFDWREGLDYGAPRDNWRAIYSANLFAFQRDCATFSLKKIQEELTDKILQEVFNGHHIVSFEYLLANPRKDVVEWALARKDELGLVNVNTDFIEEYQAIPELKELILKTLKT